MHLRSLRLAVVEPPSSCSRGRRQPKSDAAAGGDQQALQNAAILALLGRAGDACIHLELGTGPSPGAGAILARTPSLRSLELASAVLLPADAPVLRSLSQLTRLTWGGTSRAPRRGTELLLLAQLPALRCLELSLAQGRPDLTADGSLAAAFARLPRLEELSLSLGSRVRGGELSDALSGLRGLHALR